MDLLSSSIYTAACLDTDGQIGIRRRKKGSYEVYQPMAAIGQSNIKFLNQLQQEWRGHIYPNRKGKPKKPSWKLVFFGEDLENLLNHTKPYLRIKAELADLVLELRERIKRSQGIIPRHPRGPGGHQLSNDERAYRKSLYTKCRILNLNGRGKPFEHTIVQEEV